MLIASVENFLISFFWGILIISWYEFFKAIFNGDNLQKLVNQIIFILRDPYFLHTSQLPVRYTWKT